MNQAHILIAPVMPTHLEHIAVVDHGLLQALALRLFLCALAEMQRDVEG